MAQLGSRIRRGSGCGTQGMSSEVALNSSTFNEDFDRKIGRPFEDPGDVTEASNEKDREVADLLRCSGTAEDTETHVDDKDQLVKVQASIAPATAEPEAMVCGLSLKWLSLVALTLQTSAQALLIRWSKASDADGTGPQYLSSSAVFMTEVVKMLLSLCLVLHESESLDAAFAALKDNFKKGRVELFNACVPSLIYTIQNNLMFYSLEMLSAPVQQVLYQMKVVTTAGLGVAILGKTLTITQWIACFLLAFGVALVQWPRGEVDMDGVSANHVRGFIAVLAACCTSGFAGVWIQKMLQQTTASVWMRNVQLAGFGSTMSITIAMMRDGETIAIEGLFKGYNYRVVAVISMTAFGGLLCAVMLKYAGATHGCFSTALSIILTSLLSVMLGDFAPDGLFVIGAMVAVSASLLFALGLPQCLTGDK